MSADILLQMSFETKSITTLESFILWQSNSLQTNANEALLQDIAMQNDSILPLAYRLGALAAFSIVNYPVIKPEQVLLEDPYTLSCDDLKPLPIPSTDPIELAGQIGYEIERIKNLLNTEEKIPVLMIWNHDSNSSRVSYQEIVKGVILNPQEAFGLEEPRIIETDKSQIVDYTIPTRLLGVKKSKTLAPNINNQYPNKYNDPIITSLVRLGIKNSTPRLYDVDELYIGKEEIDIGLGISKKRQNRKLFDRSKKPLRRIR